MRNFLVMYTCVTPSGQVRSGDVRVQRECFPNRKETCEALSEINNVDQKAIIINNIIELSDEDHKEWSRE